MTQIYLMRLSDYRVAIGFLNLRMRSLVLKQNKTKPNKTPQNKK